MNHQEISAFLEVFSPSLSRTIVIVDFSNVEKWKESLGWRMGIRELGQLVKHFSKGNKQLRRFYYGSDFGQKDNSRTRIPWSESILNKAVFSHFEVVTKRVKYIHSKQGFEKKCDLDVEMAVDLIRLQNEYDNIVMFSGDGDLLCVLKYLKDQGNKNSYIFGARNHIGRELIDAVKEGVIKQIIYADDFEYRLSADRFWY